MLQVEFEKMRDIVLSYPRLKERIDGRENVAAERKKALKSLQEIYADFSHTTIKTFEKGLDLSVAKLYDGIHFNTNGVDLEQLVKDNCVVLVPNHQSHADYVAINYLVYKKYKFPLYVAGGKNLNIFPIGPLFRKSGCFFIRRSFANDITYKLTLEAYLYYLLMEKKPIEFFFEGGRSRTGKLLPPRYGLFGMLLEAHSYLPKKSYAPLQFVPVSIVHEYVPEQKSLTRELKGGKKKKESPKQLLKLFKLFSHQFGNLHINFGSPIQCERNGEENIKKLTQDLAFKCFRAVGKQMLVTPTSLIALVLLDEPAGALRWHDIVAKGKMITEYCEACAVPYSNSLKGDVFEKTLERTIDILIGNKQINLMGSGQGQKFYSIAEDARPELLYFKNTTLHHFLVPWIINAAWIHLFSGRLNDIQDLKTFFLDKRNQLKNEFYLPTVKDLFSNTKKVLSHAVGRKIDSLEECLDLSHTDLYAIASKLGIFSRACNYIHEAYYASALTIDSLKDSNPEGFKFEAYEKKYKEIHEQELALRRVIKYPESFSVPLMKNSLKFFTHMNLLENEGGLYKVSDNSFDDLITKYEKMLVQELTFNLRVE